MNFILVDTENVGNAWIPFLDTMEETDLITLFYSASSAKLNCNLKTLEIISGKMQQIEFLNCEKYAHSKNALDFHIASYVGVIVGKFIGFNAIEDVKINIVSNDSGFDAVVQFWSDRGVVIERSAIEKPSAADAMCESKTQQNDTISDIVPVEQKRITAMRKHASAPVCELVYRVCVLTPTKIKGKTEYVQERVYGLHEYTLLSKKQKKELDATLELLVSLFFTFKKDNPAVTQG